MDRNYSYSKSTEIQLQARTVNTEVVVIIPAVEDKPILESLSCKVRKVRPIIDYRFQIMRREELVIKSVFVNLSSKLLAKASILSLSYSKARWYL